MAKGHFVQGMQHPRIFGRGRIGQGRTNIAPKRGTLDCAFTHEVNNHAYTNSITLLSCTSRKIQMIYFVKVKVTHEFCNSCGKAVL
jgi:hypothetical protein